jgi:AraC-like DNA-binding protein
VGSAAEPVSLDYAAEFEQLVITVNADAMARKFEALNGEPPPSRLVFDHACNFRRPEAETLRQMFLFLVEQADSRGSSFHPLALAEFEQAVIVTFLSALHHNFSHLLHRPGSIPAPWQVRRAEEYIEANWDQPLTVEALALVAGVSTRSLFLSFQRNRGYSPMDFVKRVRLTHARAMLDRPNETASVTDVAFACGFGNLGHFANYYRERFGEVPSVTLQRSRRALNVWKS